MRLKTIFTFFILVAASIAVSRVAVGRSSPCADVESPAVLAAIPPPYLPVALALHANGEVIVEVSINSKGDVISSNASGHKVLADIAKRAAKQWRFAPSTGASSRTVTLVFAFHIMPSCTPTADLTPFFYPPYKIEVRGEQPSPIPSDSSPEEWKRRRCENQ